jgi:monoterpene epsilon-lactone hydrolase
VQFALLAEGAGNNQYLRSVQGGQHSFIMASGRVPEVDDAVTEMGKWLRRKLLLRAAP